MATDSGFPEFEFGLDLPPEPEDQKPKEEERRGTPSPGRRAEDATPAIRRPPAQDLSATRPQPPVPGEPSRVTVDFRHVAKELEKGSLERTWTKRGRFPWSRSKGPEKVDFKAGNIGPVSQAMFPLGKPAQIAFGQMKGGVGKSVHSISLAAIAALSSRAEELAVLFWEATKSSDLDIRLAMSEATTQRELVEGWAQGAQQIPHLENSALKEPQTGLRILFAPHDAEKYLSLEDMKKVHTVARRTCNLLVVDTDPGDPLADNKEGELLRYILLSSHAVVVPARSEYASITDAARYIRNCQELGVPQSRIWLLLTGGLLDKRNLPPSLWKHISPAHFYKIPDAYETVEMALISFKIPGLESQDLYNSYRELLRRLLAAVRAEMAQPSERTASQVARLRGQ